VTKAPMARVDRLLANMGYGSRREVQALIQGGAVMFDGERVRDVGKHLPIGPNLVDRVVVRGQPLDPPAPLTLIMNKPLGLVCSHREPGRSIYELLPPRWRARDPALSSIGRLDVDTTGLLLITDDGDFLHRIISPKAKISKRYRVVLARPVNGSEPADFASGVLMLDGETTPLLPATLTMETATTGVITIVEGRYHQVRRMFAAVGNHVLELHREQIGSLRLGGGLETGRWRVTTVEERSHALLTSGES